MKLRTVCRLAGIFSIASLLLYAFTGLALWAQVPPIGESGAMRGLFLTIAHVVGIFVGAMSLDSDIWADK